MLMLIAAAMAAGSAADCTSVGRSLDKPIAISARPLSAEEVSDAAEGPAESVAVGALIYRGNGIEVRSADPRFADLRLGGVENFTHPCGYAIQGPSGCNARDPELSRWSFKLVPTSSANAPAATAVNAIGAQPTLAGAVSGPSWPIFADGGRYFVGVMYPAQRSGESVIVAFPARSGPVAARELARVHARVEGFSATPGLHAPGSYLNLIARTPDGAIRMIVLELPADTQSKLAADLLSANKSQAR